MSPERIAPLEVRTTEVERRLGRLEDKDLPAKVDVLTERVNALVERTQEMYLVLKVVAEQTAESRGSTRTRKAIVSGGVALAGLLLVVIGWGLQRVGFFG